MIIGSGDLDGRGVTLNADRVSSPFWLAFGFITIYGSIHLGIGTLREPGSGFLPFLAGCFISLLALIVFFQSFLQKRGIQTDLSAIWKNVKWWRPIAIGLLLIPYILALETVGFLLTSVFILLAMLKGVEKLSWGKAILISISVPVVSFLVFGIFLKSSLPKGILGF